MLLALCPLPKQKEKRTHGGSVIFSNHVIWPAGDPFANRKLSMRCGSDAWTMVISTRCWVCRIGWKLVKTEFKIVVFDGFLMCFFHQACRKWHTRKDYTGYYCVGCEAYLDDDEMDEGHICKIHQKECVLRSEENYFFRLSKYWGAVRQHIEENPDFILQPADEVKF